MEIARGTLTRGTLPPAPTDRRPLEQVLPAGASRDEREQPRPGRTGRDEKAREKEGAPAARGEAVDPRTRRELEQLKQRDRQVRAHEQARRAAAGALARGATGFSYVTGPDGRRYAVGGEVRIDTSGVPGDPRATLARARQVRRAALAPADPSARDLQVAAQATSLEQQARMELIRSRLREAGGARDAAGTGEEAPGNPVAQQQALRQRYRIEVPGIDMDLIA